MYWSRCETEELELTREEEETERRTALPLILESGCIGRWWPGCKSAHDGPDRALRKPEKLECRKQF